MPDEDEKELKRLTVGLSPEEYETLKELAEQAKLPPKILLLNTAKKLVKEEAYRKFNLKYNFEAFWEIMLREALDQVKNEIEELRKELEDMREEIKEYLVSGKGGIEERDFRDLDLMRAKPEHIPIPIQMMVPAQPAPPKLPEPERQPAPQPVAQGSVLDMAFEKLEQEARARKERKAESGPRPEPREIKQPPGEERGEVRRPQPPQLPPPEPERKSEQAPPQPASQPQPMPQQTQEMEKPKVYLDESRDPPFVYGMHIIYQDDEYVIYEDNSIWDRRKKRWQKVGRWLGKIMHIEGRW